MSDERVTTATVEAFLRDLVNSNKGIPLGRYEEEKVLRDLLDARETVGGARRAAQQHYDISEALREENEKLEQRIRELEEALVGMRDMAATSGRRATSVTLEFLERVLRGGGEDE